VRSVEQPFTTTSDHLILEVSDVVEVQMTSQGRVSGESLRQAQETVEKVKAALQVGLHELTTVSDSLQVERVTRLFGRTIQTMEETAVQLKEVAAALRQIERADKAHSNITNKLVRWFSQSPTITQRFADAMTYLRELPEGESVPVEKLAEVFGWYKSQSPANQVKMTDSALRGLMADVQMVVRMHSDDSLIRYAVTPEARALLDTGIFVTLGVPGRRATNGQEHQ
jgi:hypothetical protein